MTPAERRALARRLALSAIERADAGALLASALASSPPALARTMRDSSTWVVAAGKSALPMYRAFVERNGPPAGGVVASPAPLLDPLAAIEVFQAGHPVPNRQSVAAATAALRIARRLESTDQLIVLLSGGASALLAAPAPEVTLDDKVALTRWLSSRGVAIDRLNTVRKHLSSIKGGQLAARTVAAVHTFALSDVCQPFDDDPATIGSGPTTPDGSTFGDALAVLDAAGHEWRAVAPTARARLEDGVAGRLAETVKPHDDRLARATFTVIGNRHLAALGAEEAARALGLSASRRQAALDGEARDTAVLLLAEACRFAETATRPACYIATGETTVTVRGPGAGGRNQELALAAALAIARQQLRATVVSVGTDGIDGPTNAAGAICDEETCWRARSLGLDPNEALNANDSHTLLDALRDTVVTGPTSTNVADLAIVIID